MPKLLAEHDGLRLVVTDGPNPYLIVEETVNGTEITSIPCVPTEAKDTIIWLLLRERNRLAAIVEASVRTGETTR